MSSLLLPPPVCAPAAHGHSAQKSKSRAREKPSLAGRAARRSRAGGSALRGSRPLPRRCASLPSPARGGLFCTVSGACISPSVLGLEAERGPPHANVVPIHQVDRGDLLVVDVGAVGRAQVGDAE